MRSILLNLKSGDTLQGVLWRSRGAWLTLRNPAVLKAGQSPTPIDGEVIVHRANVAFIQVLPS